MAVVQMVTVGKPRQENNGSMTPMIEGTGRHQGMVKKLTVITVMPKVTVDQETLADFGEKVCIITDKAYRYPHIGVGFLYFFSFFFVHPVHTQKWFYVS